METTLRGVGVSHGVAIGQVRHMGTAVLEPPAKQIPADEAERDLREALALRRALMPEHRFTAMSAGELGRCLTAEERYEEAEPLLLEAYGRLEALLGAPHAFTRSQAERLVRL